MVNTMKSIEVMECRKIEKGWSSDNKYLLKDSGGKKYLLRLSSIDKREEKEKEYLSKVNLNQFDYSSSRQVRKVSNES